MTRVKDSEEYGDIVEVYLLFCNNILSLSEEVVEKLESDETTCVEFYFITDNFKQKLTERQDDRFYGYLTKVKRQRLLPHEAGMAKADFTAVSYVEKRLNFSEQPLSLRHGTWTFSDIERVGTKLNLIHKVSMDELNDECSTAKPILERFQEDAKDEWKSKGVAAR
ncbi:hypothetical protein GOODEAATRI_004158 [Goodea atripinnis]|uniref:Uncharacterized protein n=1 Tax=Goodea atripinnis TaxID=208336 RepID=A0ABV0N7W9_9TELE